MRNIHIAKTKISRKTCIALSLAVVCVLVFSGCSNPRKDYLERLKLFEDKGTGDQEIPEERIKELTNEISRLEDHVRSIVKSERELGTYYKMVAVDFFDGGNFGPALDTFRKAIEIQTENPVLPYYAALSAVNLGKAKANAADRKSYFDQGEYYYLYSLKVKPTFEDSLYGLAILYLYEMDRPADGYDYIQKYLEIRPSDIRGHFVRAAAYAMAGKTEEAVDDYRWVVEHSKNGEEQTEARRNIETIIGGGN